MERKRTVVLVSADLKTRSLLRAQLLEEGLRVSAFQSLEDARQWLYIGGRVPDILVMDIWRHRPSPPTIARLSDVSDRCPVVFLTGTRERVPEDLERIGEVIRRPVSIGEIVGRIRPKG
jgi:DNA-binding NtrC family response regulator